jgi:hypothetical protein
MSESYWALRVAAAAVVTNSVLEPRVRCLRNLAPLTSSLAVS